VKRQHSRARAHPAPCHLLTERGQPGLQVELGPRDERALAGDLEQATLGDQRFHGLPYRHTRDAITRGKFALARDRLLHLKRALNEVDEDLAELEVLRLVLVETQYVFSCVTGITSRPD
jgi:hypothetical protein